MEMVEVEVVEEEMVEAVPQITTTPLILVTNLRGLTVKFVEKLAMLLLIATIIWIIVIKADILLPS